MSKLITTSLDNSYNIKLRYNKVFGQTIIENTTLTKCNAVHLSYYMLLINLNIHMFNICGTRIF